MVVSLLGGSLTTHKFALCLVISQSLRLLLTTLFKSEPMDKIFKDIVIIGGGAAGCYMSYLLRKQQISHVVITDIKSSLKYI